MEKISLFFTDEYDVKSSHDLLIKAVESVYKLKSPLISKGVYGKPFFEDAEAPRFSISHSDSIWICAISKDEVGCDVQVTTEAQRYVGIAKRFFHENELEELNRSRNQKEKFFEIWSKKEAAAKLYGHGISRDFKNIDTAHPSSELIIKAVLLPTPTPCTAYIAYGCDFDVEIKKI